MSKTREGSIDLTKHQRRVLAALLALERKHDLRWWSRDDIGSVVDAGGYHNVIQRTTIAKLKELGLVQTERSSWPEDTQKLVRCNCGVCDWGLTELGRSVAEGLLIKLPKETMARIDFRSYVKVHRDNCGDWDDSENPLRRSFDDDEDDDED